MNLPRIDSPTYDLKLPLTKQIVKFRPFLVKEQKILLMAVESGDSTFTKDNIKQILKNCCLSEINIDKLPIVDIEFFFINLRARSVGEHIETKYRCNNSPNGIDPCNSIIDVNFNLLEINVDEVDVVDKIELTPTIGIKMKYPTYNAIEKLDANKDNAALAFDFILNCIDYIYDDSKVYYAKETSKEDLNNFLESLSIDQFSKIEKFFQNLPKLEKKIDVTCPACGFNHNIVIQGLENFLE